MPFFSVVFSVVKNPGFENKQIMVLTKLLPLLFLYFIDTDFHGYLLKVHSVRESPGKVKYFHAVVHDGDQCADCVLQYVTAFFG